jgi:hypothetical protein
LIQVNAARQKAVKENGSSDGGASMSDSLLSADRNTHFKIVAVALIAATILVIAGIYARDAGLVTARVYLDGPVLKAGHAPVYTESDRSKIR